MKNTKGKQKIEMREVEDYEDRMTTFSKRKAGISKKLNEIVAQCDVEAALLVFSQAGKPHTFTHPSMEVAVGRVKSHLRNEPYGKDDTNTAGSVLVEAYKRQKNEELKKCFVDLAKELEMEEEKEKQLRESKSEKKLEEKWWNDEGSSVEELKQMHQNFVELNVSLCGSASQEKDGDGSSSDLVGRGYP